MFTQLKRRRTVGRLVQLYGHPEIRTKHRFTMKERVAHFDDMIVFCERNLSPRERARVYWRMLKSLDDSDLPEPFDAQMSAIDALLDLGHLTDQDRAWLHVKAGRLTLLYNLHYGHGEDDHVETARRLVSHEAFVRLLEEFRMENFLSRHS